MMCARRFGTSCSILISVAFVLLKIHTFDEGEQRKGDSAVGLGLRPWPSYVLHVEVVPPSGKAHLDFAIALSDEPGTWKLRVTEPLSSVTAEKSFVVREAGESRHVTVAGGRPDGVPRLRGGLQCRRGLCGEAGDMSAQLRKWSSGERFERKGVRLCCCH